MKDNAPHVITATFLKPQDTKVIVQKRLGELEQQLELITNYPQPLVKKAQGKRRSEILDLTLQINQLNSVVFTEFDEALSNKDEGGTMSEMKEIFVNEIAEKMVTKTSEIDYKTDHQQSTTEIEIVESPETSNSEPLSATFLQNSASDLTDANHEIIHLDLEEVRRDGGTQPRTKIDIHHIKRLEEQMENGQEIEPVVVFYDGTNYWLADGFHRWNAHRNQEEPTIRAIVHQGSRRDAVLYSVGANADHKPALPRSRADKHRAVLTLLNDPE
ncbi:ParB N-terminal domain-containing protein [Crocosphaera sp. XPORK-15E]|uniref:ParB N-terminal domain-containing protein n=1 Tax=Crocosphaera sp. XPORK-15E TaxID=3110247 RepID=UPI002B1F91A0|nr:ParB N-terminal domain-containing protein [Crocosphaera sp. XPORK-15E]MEA5536772.1 ParB N-terminal domain-containing protein [Crocosphaera sp. XPORK-15E]